MEFNRKITTLILIWLVMISSVSGVKQEEKDKVKKIFVGIFEVEPNDTHLMDAIGFLIRNGGIDNPEVIAKLIEIYHSKMSFWKNQASNEEDVFCGNSQCDENEDNLNCEIDCPVLTCDFQAGFICNEGQICLGIELTAADTNNCCSEQCTAASWSLCEDCGKGLFNVCDIDECNLISEKCSFDSNQNNCEPCSTYTECSDYKDEQICKHDNCEFVNCEWLGNECIQLTCIEGTTNICTTPENCEGSKTCINNNWGPCIKSDASCDDYNDVEGLKREKRASYVTGNCGNNICFCGSNTEVTNYFFADKYDTSIWEACAKEDGGSPEKIFTSSGSQNFAPLARVGLYLHNHNPDWLIQYLTVMRHSSGKATFMGGELFSATYGPPVASGILIVHNLALKLGHDQLVKETTDYLRTYWAAYSLAAVTWTIDKTIIYTEGQIQTDSGNSDFITGYTSSHVGTRTSTYGPTESAAQGMLALALNIKPRAWKKKVILNDNLHAIGRTAIAIGLPIDSAGNADIGSLNFPAYKFGLTELERKVLREFIESNGKKRLEEVMAMISDHRPIAEITYYRTENGVATWIERGVNPNKPSTVFATSVEGRTLTTLHPTDDREGPGVSKAWKEGSKICAESRHGNGRQCINLPTGNIIYEVSWSPENGMVRVQ